MLYGNIIFIKKTGGDGSKFPVTEKSIKIGRSEECLIRIYNPQVASEHCHLIIEENGQAILRNLSNQTILNGKPLGNKDVVLCHGDIFKLGERLARWEYLPTSKYYRQLLSPTGRLIAVVMPQQRPLGEPGTLRASQSSVSRNTPLGKRRYSERAAAENSPVGKIRKSSGSESIHKSRGNLSKFLTGRHSLKATKLIVQGGKPKERKSVSDMISSKTKRQVGGKLRKSSLPLWKVNIASPPGGVSLKSPRSATLPKKSESSEKALSSNSSEGALTSASSGVLKTPLRTIKESPSRSSRGSSGSRLVLKNSPQKSSSKSPSNIVSSTPQLKPPKFPKPTHSDSKINSISKKRSFVHRGSKRKTSLFEKVNFAATKEILIETSPVKVEDKNSSQIKTVKVVSDKNLQTPASDNLNNETSVTKKTSPRVAVKNTPVQKTSRKSKETKIRISPETTPKNSTVSVTQKHSRTPRISTSKLNSLTSRRNTPVLTLDNPEIPKDSSQRSTSSESPALKKTPAKLVEKFQKTTSQNQTLLSPVDKTSGLTPVRSSQRKSNFSLKKILTLQASDGKSSSPSKGTNTSRGIHRKLSPSSSAEIAAKKLKTSSPKKPDKNKKAALLVLGKANRKHLTSQNVKVLLKQKIVKKALKQSSAVSGHKGENRKKPTSKIKKGSRKKAKAISKPKTSVKIRKSNTKSTSPSKASSASTVSFPVTSVTQEDISKDVKVLEESQLNASKALQTPSRLSSIEATPKSLSKQKKKPESSFEIGSETVSPSSNFEKNTENYLLNSFRRSSKRISSKNDMGRPDFIELSPTALGLMPKNLDIFKTPKEQKRRSSSLVTPKNARSIGIIKSASTSKIINRKSVRFSPKNVSYNSEFSSSNVSEKTEFDFSSFHTPNITMDVFISPLSEKSSVAKKSMSESEIFVEKEISKSSNKNTKINLDPKLKKSSENNLSELEGVRQWFETPKNSLSNLKGVSKSLRTPKVNKGPKNELIDLTGIEEVLRTPKIRQSPRNDLTDVRGVKKLLQTPKPEKSPKNDLTDVRGVKKLLQTPKVQKSPRNDLTDVRGVKELLRTPTVQRSPKNDLTDVRGVKKLLRTPKGQKSPKNDLTDLRGVKKLLRTPKVQKSPKNDLTDVRGVKELLRTPKVQKSPKNDLTDVRGVKKLLRTPKVQKSPKNDLTDVRGVKKLLRTPKVQKSPKNDLTDVRGVKKLLRTPKVQKSPKNDLTDVRGVKKLLRTPKAQKSPKNDLADVSGVKKLLQTPKVQKSPKNDLTDLRGVKRLLGSPKFQNSPKNNLLDISGMGSLFESHIKQDLPENSADDSKKLTRSPQSEESLGKNLLNITEENQLLISKSPENISKDKKTVSRKSRISDFRAIRGRRTIYSTPKGPKNDLSDVTGVRELFIRHKSTSDYNVDLTGVSKLFDLPESEAVSQPKPAENVGKSPSQVSEIKSLRRRKVTESQNEQDENIKTRRTRLKKAANEETEEVARRNAKVKAASPEEKKPAKRKAAEKVKAVTPKKASVGAKKSQQTTENPGEKVRTRMKIKFEDDNVEVKGIRKRKTVEVPDLSPPKLRRKLRGAEESSSSEGKDTPQKSLSGSKSKAETGEKISEKRILKDSAEVKGKKMPEVSPKVQTRKAIKTSGTKQIQKVQSKRSQSKSKNNSGSEENISPRQTRSARAKTTSKVSVSTKSSTETVIKTAGRKKSSPVVTRSTRRKLK